MGKRKSSSRAKPVAKKHMEKLPDIFSCPFCSHGSGVECRMDMKLSIGEGLCCICQAHYSTSINALSEPIDVYSEWLDECEWVNLHTANAQLQPSEQRLIEDFADFLERDLVAQS